MKYEKSKGIIAKSFKMPRELADQFKEACEEAGVGQAETIRNLMKGFIEEHQKEGD